MTLAEAHPANVSWLFQQVEQQPHSMYLQALMSLVPECGGEKGLRIVFQRIAALYDTDPYLIEMEDIRALCSAADESFLEWLDSRHDLITYLCQGKPICVRGIMHQLFPKSCGVGLVPGVTN